jgi:hypothetical protein
MEYSDWIEFSHEDWCSARKPRPSAMIPVLWLAAWDLFHGSVHSGQLSEDTAVESKVSRVRPIERCG